jgi:hypothetical protein
MSITVKAKSKGFYGGSRIREGEIFEVEDESKLGKWMEKCESIDVKEEVAEEGNDSKGIPIGDYNQEPTEDDMKYLGGQSPKTLEKAKKRKPVFKG